jgi:hypothetical protein
MNRTWPSFVAALVASAAMAFLVYARADEPAEAIIAMPMNVTQTAPLTRQDVVDDLKLAEEAGTKTPDGEIGDTPRVLAAREQFNARQAIEIRARYRLAEEQALAEQRLQVASAEGKALSDDEVLQLLYGIDALPAEAESD